MPIFFPSSPFFRLFVFALLLTGSDLWGKGKVLRNLIRRGEHNPLSRVFGHADLDLSFFSCFFLLLKEACWAPSSPQFGKNLNLSRRGFFPGVPFAKNEAASVFAKRGGGEKSAFCRTMSEKNPCPLSTVRRRRRRRRERMSKHSTHFRFLHSGWLPKRKRKRKK